VVKRRAFQATRVAVSRSAQDKCRRYRHRPRGTDQPGVHRRERLSALSSAARHQLDKMVDANTAIFGGTVRGPAIEPRRRGPISRYRTMATRLRRARKINQAHLFFDGVRRPPRSALCLGASLPISRSKPIISRKHSVTKRAAT
jgi:hypothetical protein